MRRCVAAVHIAAAGLLGLACGVSRPTVDSRRSNCTNCHGDPARAPTAANPNLPAAPPLSSGGSSDTAELGVGAHQRHLVDGPLAEAVACSECHVVPSTVEAAGHLDGEVTIRFGALATSGGASAVWNRAAATCNGVYCHGAFPGGNAGNAPIWTSVDEGQAACGTCHDLPPDTGQHLWHVSYFRYDCYYCHGDGYSALGASRTVAPGLHVNGVKDIRLQGWDPNAVKPNSTTERGTSLGCHGGTRYWYVTSGTCL